MYDLPAEPNAIDIITRSIVCHPSLFADALKARYYEDREYASTRKDTVNPKTHQAIMASATAAANALQVVDEAKDATWFKNDMGAGIIALNVACKLQCLPAHVRTAAAVRTWES